MLSSHQSKFHQLNLEPWKGNIYRLKLGASYLSFEDVITDWQSADFVIAYRDCLLGLNFLEFFWEHPSITKEQLSQDYEVSIIPTTSFQGRSPNASAFQEHFVLDQSVSVFKNLSGSAWLVVPNPTQDHSVVPDYGSLARFLRNATDAEITALFAAISIHWSDQLERDTAFKYVSTHGLGVIWLHIRFDRRPKYYHTRAYRN